MSYSHALDGVLAPAVQKCLHQLARPWNRPRALRVFRDKTNLPLTDDLWMEIESALAQSRYFILLASPPAAESRWVARELAWWKEHHGPSRILVVLTDGEIVWDDGRADFDWHRTTALPGQMAAWFPAEPLWIDLRWARKENLSVRHSRFRREIAALAAPVHGTSPDELENEDLRQHRKVRLFTRAAAAALAGLGVLAFAGGVTAVVQWRHAVDRQQAAEAAQRRTAVESLLARADAARDDDPRAALRYGLAADAIAPSGATTSNLLDTLTHTRLVANLTGLTDSVNALTFAAGGNTLATGSGDSEVILWDVADPAHPAGWATPSRPPTPSRGRWRSARTGTPSPPAATTRCFSGMSPTRPTPAGSASPSSATPAPRTRRRSPPTGIPSPPAARMG
jgi:hypothetical protein